MFMSNQNSNLELAREISARIGTEPIPFDSVYSIALQIYNELGGEEAEFDSVYSILLEILPLAAEVATVIDDTSVRADKTWSSSKINNELSNKQDTLIAGSNITIENNVISATGGGGGDISTLINSVTYNELKTLRDSSSLVPGMKYRITDYETNAQDDENAIIISAEHPFDIIVTATAENKLSEVGVKVGHCEDDNYFVAKPFRYYIDFEDSYGNTLPYEGTIEIDGTTYYKWYCEDVIGMNATYILTTEAEYSNEMSGSDDSGDYYNVSYPFAGFLYNDGEEDIPVEEYEFWIEKHKCIIKTEEIDGTLCLIIGDIFLADTETYQSEYIPKLEAWEAKYCLDNDKERFPWAQVETSGTGLGFAGLQVKGDKTLYFTQLVLGDEITPAGDDYSGEGHYYIDEGQFYYKSNGTIEDNGTTYYKWYNKTYAEGPDAECGNILTTQATYTNSVSGTDGDGYEYYDNVYDIVGSMTIDEEVFGDLYKDYKKIIKTEASSQDLSGKFLYKRYEEGDTENTYAWAYVRNSYNKYINDTTVDWDDIDTTDLLYTSSEEPEKGTETGDYEVVKYTDDVQHIYDGKGVVYYLKDEFNNEAEYDFKNILFKKDFFAIQVEYDGTYYVYKRYPEADEEDNGLYAFVYINDSEGMSIEDVESNSEQWNWIDTTDIISFYSEYPNLYDWDANDEFQVMDNKIVSLGYKFTFGNPSQNPMDDTFEGKSNNNIVESELVNGSRQIPILDLGTDVVNYGKGGGTTYTAGDNIQINNNVISATDTKYRAGSNISINGSNQISCTYNYSLPTASGSTLGGVKVGSGLYINSSGILSANITLPVATTDTLGGVKVGKGLSIDENSNLSVTLNNNIIENTDTLYNFRNIDLENSLKEYLTYEAAEDDCKIYFGDKDSTGSYNHHIPIEVSSDGENWTEYTSSFYSDNLQVSSEAQGTLIATLNTGDKIYLRGNNLRYNFTTSGSFSDVKYDIIRSTKKCYVYGNLMSLVQKENFDSISTITTNVFERFNSNVYVTSSAVNKLYNHPTKKLYIYANSLENSSAFRFLFMGTNISKISLVFNEIVDYNAFRSALTPTTDVDIYPTMNADSLREALNRYGDYVGNINFIHNDTLDKKFVDIDDDIQDVVNEKANKVDFVIPVNIQTQVTDWTVLNNAAEGIYRVKVVADMMGTSVTMLEGWATVTNSMGTIAQTLVLTQMIPSAQGSPLTIHNRVSVDNGTTWNDYEFNLGVINDSHSSTESTYSSNKIESLISALDARLTAMGG